MRGIDLVAAVGGAGGNDADRGRVRHHGPDLDRGGVGAEKPPVGKIEGILLVARRMVGGGVQRVEAVPLGLDVGAVGDGEAEPAEDLDGAVDQQGERVERTRLGSRAREGCVDGSERGRVGLGGEGVFLLLKGCRDGGAQVVEKLPHDGSLLLGEGAHSLAEQRDGTGLAEEADACLLQRRGVGRSRDCGERLDPELLDLGFHGRDPGELPASKKSGGFGFRCLRLGLEGGLGLGNDLGEGALVLDRDVRKDLAVEQDVGGLEALDEAVVGHPLGTHGGVQTGDPERADVALAGLAVAVRPVLALHPGILRVAEEFGTAAAVSAGLFDDPLATCATGG